MLRPGASRPPGFQPKSEVGRDPHQFGASALQEQERCQADCVYQHQVSKIKAHKRLRLAADPHDFQRLLKLQPPCQEHDAPAPVVKDLCSELHLRPNLYARTEPTVTIPRK